MKATERTNLLIDQKRQRRRKKHGSFAPGKRAERWVSACNTQAILGIIFSGFWGFAALTNEGAWQGTLIASALSLLGLWSIRQDMKDAKRGWKLSYEIPERAWKEANGTDLNAEYAKKSIDRTLKEAENPNRKKYAFE